jgi:amino acid permease
MAAEPVLDEKSAHDTKQSPTTSDHDVEAGESQPAELHRGLQGRHMQMIAIGNKCLTCSSQYRD